MASRTADQIAATLTPEEWALLTEMLARAPVWCGRVASTGDVALLTAVRVVRREIETAATALLARYPGLSHRAAMDRCITAALRGLQSSTST